MRDTGVTLKLFSKIGSQLYLTIFEAGGIKKDERRGRE